MTTWYQRYWPGPVSRPAPSETIITSDLPAVGTLHTGQYPFRMHRKGGMTRFYVLPQSWGSGDVDEVRAALEGLPFPVRATPGKTGRVLLLEQWQGAGRSRWHRRLNGAAEDMLDAYLVGGRIQDGPTAGMLPAMPGDITIDEEGAYLRHAVRLPTGVPYQFSGTPSEEWATWFAPCEVIRPRKRWGRPDFPIIPLGREDRWSKREGIAGLWREEVELAREHGYTITVGRGYAWRWFTDDLTDWAARLEHEKHMAATSGTRRLVKLIAAATIGSFRRVTSERFLRDGETRQDGDRPVSLIGPEAGRFIREEAGEVRSMLHWYSYVVMQTRLAVTQAALPYVGKGLVSIHTDSLQVREQVAPLPEGFRLKETR